MDINTSISERIQALIDTFCNGKNSQFAKAIGVAESNIRSYLAGTQPKFDILSNIALKFAISCEWLLTGKGDMLKTPNTPSSLGIPQDIPPQKSSGLKVQKAEPGSGKGIPLIPMDAIAGFPADDNGAAYFEDCERYVIPEFENKGANFLIRVSGDSMIPLYYGGDLLACHKLTDIRFFQWGTVYVLETSQGVIVKRVHESENHDDCILCVSENAAVHKPFLLPKDDIRSLSTIIGLVRLI